MFFLEVQQHGSDQCSVPSERFGCIAPDAAQSFSRARPRRDSEPPNGAAGGAGNKKNELVWTQCFSIREGASRWICHIFYYIYILIYIHESLISW